MATFWVSGDDKEEAVDKERTRGANTHNEGEEDGGTKGESEVVKDNPMSGQAWEIDFGSEETVKKIKKIPKFLTRVRAQRSTPDTTECKVHPTSTPPARTGVTRDATSSAKRKEGRSPSASSCKSTSSLIVKSHVPATSQPTPTKSTSTRKLFHTKPAMHPKTSTPLSSSSSSTSSFSSIPRKKKEKALIPPQSFSAPSSGAKGASKPKHSSPSSSRLSLSSPKTLFLKRKTPDTSKTAKKTPLSSSTQRPLAQDKLGESHVSPVRKNQSVNAGEYVRGRGGKEGGSRRKREVLEGKKLQSSSSDEKLKTSMSKIAVKFSSPSRRPLAQDKVRESRTSPATKSPSLNGEERWSGGRGPGKEGGRGREGETIEGEMSRCLSNNKKVGEVGGGGGEGGGREGAKWKVEEEEEEGDGSEVLASGEEREKISFNEPDYGGAWQTEWTHTKTPLQPPQTQPQELKTTVPYGDKETVGEVAEMKGGRGGGGGRGEREERTQLPVVTIPSLGKEAERDRSRAALYPNDMSSRKVFDLKRWYARGCVYRSLVHVFRCVVVSVGILTLFSGVVVSVGILTLFSGVVVSVGGILTLFSGVVVSVGILTLFSGVVVSVGSLTLFSGVVVSVGSLILFSGVVVSVGILTLFSGVVVSVGILTLFSGVVVSVGILTLFSGVVVSVGILTLCVP